MVPTTRSTSLLMRLTNHAIDPEFFEARAIVFSKMGQHRQALEIYVFKLEDYAKAEEYVQRTTFFICILEWFILIGFLQVL